MKGAASDCLKKCATLFGVALDLYGRDYEAQASSAWPANDDFPYDSENRPGGTREPLPPRTQSAPAPIRSNGATSDLEATDRQRNLIQTLARDLKINGAGIDDLAREVTGASVTGINRKNASKLIDVLQERRQAREAIPQ